MAGVLINMWAIINSRLDIVRRLVYLRTRFETVERLEYFLLVRRVLPAIVLPNMLFCVVTDRKIGVHTVGDIDPDEPSNMEFLLAFE